MIAVMATLASCELAGKRGTGQAVMAECEWIRASAELNLTSREREVLRLLVEGQSDAAIADALGLKPSTISEHVGNLLAKTGRPNRVALAVYAVRKGWV